MKSFHEYIKIRETAIPDGEDQEPINPADTDSSGVLTRLINLAWKKHTSRTKLFLQKLASLDSEIAGEYERLDPNADESPVTNNSFGDKDVIRPATADQSAGLDQYE